MPTNMFVPIDLLKPILSDLKLSGRSQLPLRPWLGVRTEELYGRLIVERVVSGSPSEKAGIVRTDYDAHIFRCSDSFRSSSYSCIKSI